MVWGLHTVGRPPSPTSIDVPVSSVEALLHVSQLPQAQLIGMHRRAFSVVASSLWNRQRNPSAPVTPTQSQRHVGMPMQGHQVAPLCQCCSNGTGIRVVPLLPLPYVGRSWLAKGRHHIGMGGSGWGEGVSGLAAGRHVGPGGWWALSLSRRLHNPNLGRTISSVLHMLFNRHSS